MRKAGVWQWVVATLAASVGFYSLRYLLPSVPAEATNVAANRFAPLALTAHAGLGATVLILGAIQFFPGLRTRWPARHRRAGTVYVAGALIGGLAGLILAFWAAGRTHSERRVSPSAPL